jgi:heterotetrameric sarcosine oxidase delta subunit
MLIIACPFCGPRDEIEFRYKGDAGIARPSVADEDAFAAHVYERSNPAGMHREWWLHVGGCRQLLAVERDTITHEITSVGVTAGSPRIVAKSGRA